MKKLLMSSILLSASTGAMAVAPGGPDCGWGNMLLEGQNGLGIHLAATLTNGTSGNGTFGMTFGTNGCSTDGALTYGGNALVWLDDIMDEYSTDVAMGDGEALKAVAVMLGIEQNDRDHFGAVMHENFDTLFPSTTVTSQEVLDSMIALMADDQRLQRYVG